MSIEDQFKDAFEVPEGWHIMRDPKPIPDRRHDWEFWHDDYDGADGGNGLCGTGSSYIDCLNQIHEKELER